MARGRGCVKHSGPSTIKRVRAVVNLTVAAPAASTAVVITAFMDVIVRRGIFLFVRVAIAVASIGSFVRQLSGR